MTAYVAIDADAPAVRSDGSWRVHLAAAAALAAAILVLFRRDAADMVRIWLTASTYNHCALILPIIFWLAWQRLPELRGLAPRAWPPGLLLVALSALGWLLGDAGGVAVARHAGLVLMLQCAFVACLGKSVSRGLAFPIFYTLFLIPAGEEILPQMQAITAQISMVLLGFSGIPAHLDGIFITIPNGYFRVAEACAGVKFLVAMVALGALVANVCFVSRRRRIAFMAASVAIPVLANGVRAFGTIAIAYVTDTDFASGFDHVVYGWIFFAIVIALLMGAGWRFFDRRPGDPWFDPAALQQGEMREYSTPRLAAVAVTALALAAMPPLWFAALAASGEKAEARAALPEIPGWRHVAMTSARPWRPHYAGADSFAIGRYRDEAGRQVDLAVAVFARQGEGHKLVGYGQGAAGPDSGWSHIGDTPAPPDGRAERIVSFGETREVASFYRVGRILTGSEARVKLETMKIRLFGGPQRAVAVLVSAEAPAQGVSPRPAIDAFLKALGPVDRLADRAAGLKG